VFRIWVAEAEFWVGRSESQIAFWEIHTYSYGPYVMANKCVYITYRHIYTYEICLEIKRYRVAKRCCAVYFRVKNCYVNLYIV